MISPMASDNTAAMISDNSLPNKTSDIDKKSKSIPNLAPPSHNNQDGKRNSNLNNTDSAMSKEISYEDDFQDVNDASQKESSKR